jgi:hypothetical protein
MRGAGHANREALHASRKRPLVVGLDDEVQMVRLHREVHHAKARLLAFGNRLLDACQEQLIAAKARQSLADLHRNVHGMPGEMPLATAVWHANLAR